MKPEDYLCDQVRKACEACKCSDIMTERAVDHVLGKYRKDDYKKLSKLITGTVHKAKKNSL